MWDVMSFSLRWPPKIRSTVRMISFRPNFPRLWSVADDYLCSLHISLPDWLETVNVINFEVSIYVSLRTVTLPPPSSKGWDFKFAHWKQPVKVFSSLEQQSHCTTHQEGLNVNISLLSAQTVANFSNFLAVFQYSHIIYTTFDFFFFSLFYYLKVRWFSTPNILQQQHKKFSEKLGDTPYENTLDLQNYRIHLGSVEVGLILDIKVNSNSLWFLHLNTGHFKTVVSSDCNHSHCWLRQHMEPPRLPWIQKWKPENNETILPASGLLLHQK